VQIAAHQPIVETCGGMVMISFTPPDNAAIAPLCGFCYGFDTEGIHH
jgi:hypothetical protein